MAREPRGEREMDDRVPEGKEGSGEDAGHIKIMVGDTVIQAYDGTHLGDDQRRDIASRIVRYADSQTLGLRRVK
jgi:hypothetical protein